MERRIEGRAAGAPGLVAADIHGVVAAWALERVEEGRAPERCSADVAMNGGHA